MQCLHHVSYFASLLVFKHRCFRFSVLFHIYQFVTVDKFSAENINSSSVKGCPE